MHIKTKHIEPTYQKSVRGFLYQSFPQVMSEASQEDLLEGTFEAIMGSGQVRYGPKPNIESQAAIRSVVRAAISDHAPIPVLMPYGSRKPDISTGVDVADLSALRMLEALNNSVRTYYAPGLDIRLRLEDTTGEFLFEEEGESFLRHSRKYVQDMINLIEVLGMTFISPVKESDLMRQPDSRGIGFKPEFYDTDGFWKLARDSRELFVAYLTESRGLPDDQKIYAPTFIPLMEAGWNGPINDEQRAFYINQYKRRYPAARDEELIYMLATYFASVRARVLMGAMGQRTEWGKDYLKFYFGAPVPGVPKELVDKTIHYRTIPASFSRNHIAPWRSRGYLRIHEDGTATPALMSPFEAQHVVLQPASVTFETDHKKVEVDVSYREVAHE